ncbi:hypothetical protein TIFTF001_022731 [Ficus carica]|uniref:NB-ARC domain-containing protein n=1 Tax=Ficus carica TaxID=3494 RepID=A0AA88AZN4_FICCA|nr:hypothetical protein TIFTF001_022731 [Ficus carica]
MVASITRRNVEDLDFKQLVELLSESLHGKQYLIVLDDVWNDDRTEWMELKDVFRAGASGSAIILTSRSLKVASVARTVHPFRTCDKIHDLIHDLAIDVAGKQCQHLFDSQSSFSETIHRRAFHVSFGSDVAYAEQVSASLKGAENLRSILLPSHSWRKVRGRADDKVFNAIISRYRFLWVLDMHALGIKKVPYSIGKLKHLRYLDLFRNEDII